MKSTLRVARIGRGDGGRWYWLCGCMAAMFLQCATAQDSPSLPDGDARPALIAPKAAQNRLLDIARAGAHLVAVGQHGVILRSEDGAQWRQVESPVGVMLTRVRFTDPLSGWALGYDASILQTVDGGRTWALRHRDTDGHALYDLLFFDPRHGLAVGAYGSMLSTRDGGASWTAMDPPLAELGMHLNAVIALGDASLLVVGERGLMARSVDQARTWTLIDGPYAGSLFGGMAMGAGAALVHGMRGNVYVADDLAHCPPIAADAWDPYARSTVTDREALAALGWRRLDSPVQESLFGALRLNGQGVLLVGVNGTALSWDGAGTALQIVKTAAAETLTRALSFNGRLIAVGRRGVEDLGPLQ